MKTGIFTSIAAATMIFASSAAFAASCPTQVKAVDEALKNTELSKADTAKVKELRNDGAAKCKAGKNEEAMKSLSQAKQILGVK